MPTFSQLSSNVRKKRFIHWKKRALNKCPQKFGTCIKAYFLSPKKPCSANRYVGRVKLSRFRVTIFCFFPGNERPRRIKRHATLYVRGGRPNDLPAVKYKAIRRNYQNSRNKGDFFELYGRVSSRSMYAVRNNKIQNIRDPQRRGKTFRPLKRSRGKRIL